MEKYSPKQCENMKIGISGFESSIYKKIQKYYCF